MSFRFHLILPLLHVYGLLFVVAFYVHVRRDSGGSIASIPGASDILVYFLLNQNASLSVTMELQCSFREQDGEVEVSSLFIIFSLESLVNSPSRSLCYQPSVCL